MSKTKSKTKPKTASKNIPNKAPKKVAKTIVKKTKKPKVAKTAKTPALEDAATKQALYIEKTDDVHGLEIKELVQIFNQSKLIVDSNSSTTSTIQQTNNIEHVAAEPTPTPEPEPTTAPTDDHAIVAANTTHIDDYKSYDVPTTCGQYKDNTVWILCVSFAIGVILWMIMI